MAKDEEDNGNGSDQNGNGIETELLIETDRLNKGADGPSEHRSGEQEGNGE